MVNTDKTKVLVIGPSLKMGGMERAAANIANAMHEAGFDVVFAVLFDHVVFFKLHPDIRFLAPSGYNSKRMNFWKTVARLRAITQRERPDLILVYNKFYAALVLFSLFFLRSKPKVFMSERSSPLYRWSRRVRLFNAFVFRTLPADGVIAQTAIAAQYQRKYYPRVSVVKVIPNILRPVKRYPEIQRGPRILAVGRFNDSLKGFDRLLQAFALVKAHPWKIIFAGGSKGEDRIIDGLINDLALDDYVDFAGRVSDVDLLYATASIFVIPSRSEGFPNALVEAMSAGMACISYDFVGGPSEIIRHGIDGLLVKEGDIQGLAAKLLLLMNNPTLRAKLGTEASKVSDRLSADVIVKKHTDFFNDIMSAKGGARR